MKKLLTTTLLLTSLTGFSQDYVKASGLAKVAGLTRTSKFIDRVRSIAHEVAIQTAKEKLMHPEYYSEEEFKRLCPNFGRISGWHDQYQSGHHDLPNPEKASLPKGTHHRFLSSAYFVCDTNKKNIKFPIKETLRHCFNIKTQKRSIHWQYSQAKKDYFEGMKFICGDGDGTVTEQEKMKIIYSDDRECLKNEKKITFDVTYNCSLP